MTPHAPKITRYNPEVMTIQHQAQMENLRQFFEDLSVDWDDRQPAGRDQLLHELLAPYDPFFSQCRSILEVGTGTGALIPVLRERYPDTNLVSMDIAHRMLTKAGARQPGTALIQADIHHLPIAPGQFDGLICHNAFPHFWWMQEALVEMKKVLRAPGHLLIFHDISREHVNAVHQKAHNPIIHDDILPEGLRLAKMLKSTGFLPLQITDQNDRYIIYAKIIQSHQS